MLTPPAPRTQPAHYHVIDLLRGMAAISVLFWHYIHFFMVEPGILPADELKPQLPLYSVFAPFYEYGNDAVQLFWLISGFVFCAVYMQQGTSTRKFIVNRFARLYPLHFITLIVVAVLQLASLFLFNQFLIYPNNDLKHFALNLFMASRWGLEYGHSFNEPIWSVSVEIVIYALFWMILPWLYRRRLAGAMIATVFFWVVAFHTQLPGHTFIAECGFYFFAGTGLFMAYQAGQRHPAWLLAFAGLLMASGLFVLDRNLDHYPALGRPALLGGIALIGCALEAFGCGGWAKRAKWIGDNTYGCYLWHVPIQLVALIVMDALQIGRSVALSPWFLIGFLVLVSGVARLSFLHIESPLRFAIRQRFEAGSPASANVIGPR